MTQLEDFILDYARSYETYDPDKVGAFINTPCTFCLGDNLVLLDTEDRIKEFMQAGLAAYKANGCVYFKARLHGERRIGSSFAMIYVEWSPENADGERTMHFSTSYNLVKHAGSWKVVLITRHDPQILTGPVPR